MSQPSDFPFESSWLALLKDLSVDAREVMRRAGLPEDLLSRTGSRISTPDYFRFWRALEQTVDDPALALRVVETVTTEAFSPAMFAALCSPSLRVAIERLANYKRLIAPMQLDLTETPEGLRLVVRWLRNADAVPESWAGAELAFLVRLARIGTREHVTPRSVGAPRRLEPESAYREFFGVGVSEAPEYAIDGGEPPHAATQAERRRHDLPEAPERDSGGTGQALPRTHRSFLHGNLVLAGFRRSKLVLPRVPQLDRADSRRPPPAPRERGLRA